MMVATFVRNLNEIDNKLVIFGMPVLEDVLEKFLKGFPPLFD